MRISATESTDAGSAAVKETRDQGPSWFKVHRCVLSLAVIMILGLVLRFVFSYGISAPDDYALSGGTNASSHFRVILEILAGTYDPSAQAHLNYPFGIESSSGPFYDYLMAGFASVGGLFGVSDPVAAAGAMAWSSPIIGILTVIPLFLLAKKLTDDETIAIVSALVYTFTAVIISVTPFSYGGEYALLGFLSVCMGYMIVSAVDAADKARLSGLGSIRDRAVLVPSVVAGVLYGLCALTWPDFRVIPIVTAVVLAIHLIISRVSGRDIGVSSGIAVLYLGIGTLVAGAYYIPEGLFGTVFMGGCALALFTIAYTLLFVAVEKKPWVLTVPCFIAAIIVVGVLLAVFTPDLSRSMFQSTNMFADGIVRGLSEMFSRNSISSMATWFGWLSLWFPIFLGIYLIAKYRKKAGTRKFDLTVFGLWALFVVSWFTTGYAILAAPVIAISIAYVAVVVIRQVDMRGYLTSLRTLRGSGYKGAAKKVFNFFPFVTFLVIVGLVIAPNALNAFDAATPSNDEKSDYYGGVGYTINTSDFSIVGSTWSNYSDTVKDGALLTWYGYSDEAAVFGNFDIVTSPYGNGTQAMTVALMQHGSAGAIASMLVRILEERDTDEVGAALSGSDADPEEFCRIISDPRYAESTLQGSDYYGLHLDDGLRVYYGIFNYLFNTLELSESEIAAIYDRACQVTGDKIGYIQVDTAMLPIAYYDGDYFPTIAHLGGYDVTSGGVEDFYTVQNYFDYAFYSPAMYNTFAYQALFGAPPSFYGVGNSLSYFGYLASSDGDYKPVPGYGLAGFEVDYWHVMYNPDSEATASSSGWIDMDAHEAIQKQDADGGVINYLKSSVVMKYVGVPENVFSGNVYSDDGTNVSDVTVNVYADLSGFDPSSKISRVLYSSCVTDSDGNYTVALPVRGGYYTGTYSIVYSTSAEPLSDGNVFMTSHGSPGNLPETDIQIDGSIITHSSIVGGDDEVLNALDADIEIVRADGKTKYTGTIVGGYFSVGDYDEYILPGTYKATVYAKSGASLFTCDLTVVPGEMEGITLKATTYKLEVTVNDIFERPIAGEAVEIIDTATGEAVATPETASETDDDGATKGVASAYVLPGTYICRIKVAGMDGDIFGSTTAPVVVTSSDKAVTIVGYDQITVRAQFEDSNDEVDVNVESPVLSTVLPAGGVCALPMPYDYAMLDDYSAWAFTEGKYYVAEGITSEGEHNYVFRMIQTDYVRVSGTVHNNDGAAAEGATVVIDAGGTYHKTVTGKDGKYQMLVAKGGDAVICAYDASNNVKYMKRTVEGDITDADLTLAEGQDKSLTIYYYTGTSPSTRVIPYFGAAGVTLSIDGGETFELRNVMTDASGKMHVVTPKDYQVKLSVGPYETSCYFIGVTDGEGKEDPIVKTIDPDSATAYIYMEWYADTSKAVSSGYFKPIAANLPDDVKDGIEEAELESTKKATFDGEYRSAKYKIANGIINGGEPILPGEYKLTITKGLYHYPSTSYVYVYPVGAATVVVEFGDSLYEYYTVTVKGSQDDEFDIETDGLSDYKDQNEDVDGEREYYIEKGHEALISAADSDGNKAFVQVSENDDGNSFELKTKYKMVTVSGSVSMSSAAGDILFKDFSDPEHVRVFKTSVSSGTYSIELPGVSVGAEAKEYTVQVEELKATKEDDGTYTYIGGGTLKVIDSDVTFNIGVTTESKEDEKAEYAELVDASMDGGAGTVTLKLLNNEDMNGVYYMVSGSEGFILDETYYRYVPADVEYVNLTVAGSFNPFKYGAGSDKMAVTVKSADGTVLKTITVPADAFESPTGKVPEAAVVEVAGEGSETYDSVNGCSYTYSISVENPNSFAISAKVTGTISVPEGWRAYVSFDGYNIVGASEGLEYEVPGFGKVTASVILVSSDKFSYDVIPDLQYTVGAKTLSGDDVPLEGDPQAGTLKHVSGSVTETGGNVEGADNSAKSVSTAFYILMVFAVLLLLLFVYSANKRGVFSRK